MLLTEEQAAAELQVDRRTVRRLIESGRLHAIDVGGGRRSHYRIHPDALRDITSGNSRPPAAFTPLQRERRRRSREPSTDSVDSCFPSVS